MYPQEEVIEMLKKQKEICANIAGASYGRHVLTTVINSPDLPLVKKTDLLHSVINWVAIDKNTYPKDTWVYLVTDDKAHHLAYYSKRYDKWIANSKLGGNPIWWAYKCEPPCLERMGV